MAENFIDQIPRLSISDLKGLFKATSKGREGDVYGFRFSFRGREYTATHSKGWGYIVIRFTDRQGRKREEMVDLLREKSNLGRGEVVFFVCPHTDKKCRKLFLDGNVVVSRYGFKHRYSYQNHSRRQRLLDGIEILREDREPYHDRGKFYYNGKPTRYMRKVERYWRLRERFERRFEQYKKPIIIGRPPKDKRMGCLDMGFEQG